MAVQVDATKCVRKLHANFSYSLLSSIKFMADEGKLLAFADDLILMVESHLEAECILEQLELLQCHGVILSVTKLKS